MADLSTIKGRIQETIYPNGAGAIKAVDHRDMLLELVDEINDTKQDVIEDLDERFDAKQDVIPDLDARFDAKQDVISDLATIRAGAKKGATAVQPEDLENYIPGGGSGEGFDTTGYYPEMSVGTADNLIGRGESVPAEFSFRATGGKSIKDGRAYIKRIKGNSVVWNQKVKGFASWNLQGGAIEGNEVVWSAESRTGVLNAYSNTFAQHTTHKYLITADVKASSSNVGLGVYFTNSPLVKHTGSGNYESLAIITNGKGDGIDACYLTDTSTSGYGEIRAKNYRCIDLTQMFQAGNEPTTIEEYNARKPIVADEYAYNEGEVIHMNTESIKSVGDNAWDEQWEVGAINQETGELIETSNAIRSKNFCRMIGGENYNIEGGDFIIVIYDENYQWVDYWTASASSHRIVSIAPNVRYFKLFAYVSPAEYSQSYMVSLAHSGWKQDTDAGYQPYWQDTLPLPIIRKYFPQGMKSAGSAHDEISYNKTTKKWEAVRRISFNSNGIDITGFSGGFCTMKFKFRGLKAPNDRTQTGNIIVPGYIAGPFDKCYKEEYPYVIGVIQQGDYAELRVYDPTLTTFEQAKEYLKALGIYYELAEPVVTVLDAADQDFINSYQVADFGTEQAISSVASAPFSADIIYQFNAVDLIREHELEIKELQRIVAELQSRLS